LISIFFTAFTACGRRGSDFQNALIEARVHLGFKSWLAIVLSWGGGVRRKAHAGEPGDVPQKPLYYFVR
jgi:hypothetical protein